MLHREDRVLAGRALGRNHGYKLYSSESFVRNLDIVHELEGHTGCVNALCWSADGQYLASGSDDTNVLIWNAHADMDNSKVIHTGHTRNIFGVKFLPKSGNRTIVSVAGDRQIRVFDVEYGASSARIMYQPCERYVYRDHCDRVKRIAMEHDGYCFLTCAEDGDIRQFDLRETQRTNSPKRTPLVSYARQQIDLNTITMSQTDPYLFATGGSHPCAFLHDRRMVGRDLHNEWGRVPTGPGLTNCVRKFRSSKAVRSTYRGEHLTALQFGKTNGRDLLGSWSADDVYLFDIHGDTDRKTTGSCFFNHKSTLVKEDRSSKRKRERSVSGPLHDFKDQTIEQKLASIRMFLLTAPFKDKNYAEAYHNCESGRSGSTTKLNDSGSSNVLHNLKIYLHLLACLSRQSFREEYDFSCSTSWAETNLPILLDVYSSEHYLPRFMSSPHANEPRLDEPILDYTRPGHQIFGSIEILSRRFNALIADDSGLQSMHTDAGRYFWLERVAISLLARQESQVSDQVPVQHASVPISGIEYGMSLESGFADHIPSDVCPEDLTGTGSPLDSVYSRNGSDSSDYDDIDIEEDEDEEGEDEATRQQYEQDINNAIEAVESGVPIVMPSASYNGHINVETVKDVNFFGQEDEYVMSGSDDGILFIWNKKTGKIVSMLQADNHVTNVMEGHPTACMLAASGIDDSIKIFEPMEQPASNSRRVSDPEYQIRARNQARAAGEDSRESNNIRISRRMLMSLVGQAENGQQVPDDCRVQ